MHEPVPDIAALRRRTDHVRAGYVGDPGAAASMPASPLPLQAMGTASLRQIGALLRPALLAPVLPESGLMPVYGPAPEAACALGLRRATAWRSAGKIAPAAANFPGTQADGG